MKTKGDSNLDEAIEVIADAENLLRKLAATAADQGDYDAVVAIADWARAVGAICESERFMKKKPPHASPPPNGKSKEALAKSQRSSTTGIYPKFFRQEDSLIKVGWSKSSKAEYEHRSPATVIRQLADAITAKAKKTGLVTMDAILPLYDDEGAEVPSYRCYLTLAWLKNANLIRQHGRKGYSLTKGVNLGHDASAAFDLLNNRH